MMKANKCLSAIFVVLLEATNFRETLSSNPSEKKVQFGLLVGFLNLK